MKVDKRGQNLTKEIRQKSRISTENSMTEEQKRARNVKGGKVLARSMTPEQRRARALAGNAARQETLRKRAEQNAK